MRRTRRALRAGIIGTLALVIAPAARAQVGTGRGLGGFGGSMTEMGGGGTLIPYSGQYGGFMPYRMGGGGSGGLSFQARGGSPVGSGRTSFGLSPMSGGVSPGAGPRMSSFGSRGLMGTGGGMSPAPGARGMGVMPPSFGYPFRQPPSLLAPSSSGVGMSM